MPKVSSRPTLPTSSSDFALPPSSSNAGSSAIDESSSLLPRFRRPSILAPKTGYNSETRLNSPLASSFTLHPSPRRRSRHVVTAEGSESDKERMLLDSSPSSSSQNPTPPEYSEENDKDTKKSVPPLTPPRKLSTSDMDVRDLSIRPPGRRLSFPLRAPRIRSLLAESRPEENEVKSEAAFQRLINSGSELPVQPRTPRAPSDRGRYPEEAGQEDSQREGTPSDDSDGGDELPLAFHPNGTEPIRIATATAHTPANSINGDDMTMPLSESPNGYSMDVDMPYGSPSLTTQWRYTPPPTTSAVRSNKRKIDDRFDPYPSASKRRAVSPSFSCLRDSHQPLMPPALVTRTSSGPSRFPMPISVPLPGSTASSTASSPTIGGSFPSSGLTLSRPVCITSSPTLRASVSLASPILRPLPRSSSKRSDEEEREIAGAGEAVGGLSIA